MILFAQLTYLLKIGCKIGTLRIPRLELSDFTIGHHSTIVKKKKMSKLDLSSTFPL